MVFLFVYSSFYSQNSDYKLKTKHLDSLVSKADTIFILFDKEINFVQFDVPIYDFQIEKEKFRDYEKFEYDTLKDGRLIYKNLPGQFDRKSTNNPIRKQQQLIFENDVFKMYNQHHSKKNRNTIGYENRTCLNDNNTIFNDECNANSFYKYTFYHSYIKHEYQKKYLDYIKYRDFSYKKYGVRYSGRSPNIESGAIGSVKANIKVIGEKSLFFFIDSTDENLRDGKVMRISLPFLDAILKPNKVYFLRTNHNYNGKGSIFEEVKIPEVYYRLIPLRWCERPARTHKQ